MISLSVLHGTQYTTENDLETSLDLSFIFVCDKQLHLFTG